MAQLRADGGPAISRKTCCAISRQRGDDPVSRNRADAAIAGIRDKEVACPAYRDATGAAQLRFCREPPVARETRYTIARHGGDDPIRGNPANALIAGVRDE